MTWSSLRCIRTRILLSFFNVIVDSRKLFMPTNWKLSSVTTETLRDVTEYRWRVNCITVRVYTRTYMFLHLRRLCDALTFTLPKRTYVWMTIDLFARSFFLFLLQQPIVTTTPFQIEKSITGASRTLSSTDTQTHAHSYPAEESRCGPESMRMCNRSLMIFASTSGQPAINLQQKTTDAHKAPRPVESPDIPVRQAEASPRKSPCSDRISSSPTDESALFKSIHGENTDHPVEKLSDTSRSSTKVRPSSTASSIRLAMVSYSIHCSLLSTGYVNPTIEFWRLYLVSRRVCFRFRAKSTNEIPMRIYHRCT
jgi:hypothetical protein